MPMANAFFPQADEDEWRFVERNSLQEPVMSFRATTTADGTRKVAIDAPGHRFNGFFDRMTITDADLVLERIHFANATVDIPPWLVTLGPGPDRVDDVLPRTFDGRFGVIHGPFVGEAITTAGDSGPGIELVISGVGGTVLEMTMQLELGRGIVGYRGQTYGVFAIYERVD